MKSSTAFVPLLGLVLGTAIAQNPVPTRIGTNLDGQASGVPEPVSITVGIDAASPTGPQLLLSGGSEGRLALLALGIRPIEQRLEEAILLIEPLITVPGEFGKEGTLGLPLDLANTAMIGQTWYAQGVQYSPPPMGEMFQLSARLGVRFAAGNPQPQLFYNGPPLTATLVTKRVQDLAASHEVLSSVLAPTGGYELRLQSTSSAGGVTHVWLTLEAPGPDEKVSPEPEIRRVDVPLGGNAEPRIEVAIEQTIRGQLGARVFLLAAVIERDF